MDALDPWYLRNLVCPLDKTKLEFDGQGLISQNGRRYPVVDGVPVLLLETESQTIEVARASIERAAGSQSGIDWRAPQFYLETLGISEAEKVELVRLFEHKLYTIDPVAMMIIGATSGYAYAHWIGNRDLREYPIPEISLPKCHNESLLDIGCNWGRWSMAAARKGYEVVGVDPSLGAVLAARRIAKELGLNIKYLVADGRFLPFKNHSFKNVYSYSVLQHFSKSNMRKTLAEVGRVLEQRGCAKIQMANRWGLRSFHHQAARGFREPRDFEVRYWSVSGLKTTFEELIGQTTIAADCYFGLGWQWSDFKLMKNKYKLILVLSEILKRLSKTITPLTLVADSVFCSAIKR